MSAPVLYKRIIFFSSPCILACDGRCDKAWGINGRTRRVLSSRDDDYVFLPDSELGTAPGPGETVGIAEGNHMKPSATALAPEDSAKLNKWCARECERSVIVDVECADVDMGDTCPEGIEVPDLEHPQPNRPQREGGS
jgi:hypothetical protein